VLGDLDFDLREVTIDRQRTAVTVLAVLGNADIYVPDGINVEVSGFPSWATGATGAATRTIRTRRPFRYASSDWPEPSTCGGCRTACRPAVTAISPARCRAARYTG
jgi:Cell wall-active antibiotics response 4TMS YvqF